MKNSGMEPDIRIIKKNKEIEDAWRKKDVNSYLILCDEREAMLRSQAGLPLINDEMFSSSANLSIPVSCEKNKDLAYF